MESAAYFFRPGSGWVWIIAAFGLFLAWKAITNCMFQPRNHGDEINLTLKDFHND